MDKNIQKKQQLLKQIKALPTLVENTNLDGALKYSKEHPETQPHFIIRKDKSHVIVY